MHFSFRNMHKGRDVATKVQKGMKLNRTFGLAKLAHGKSERHRSIVEESKA